MTIQSDSNTEDYYYYAWTDSDSYINIAKLNFNNLNDISSIKSEEKIIVQPLIVKLFQIMEILFVFMSQVVVV